MADHLRRRIREAVAGAVTGLATTAARVYQSRVYPLEADNLPGLLVHTRRERSQANSLHAPRTLERSLQLEIVAVARATADLDDVLDGIAKDVEQALAMPCAALAGLAKWLTLTETSIELSGDGQQPLGAMTLVYDVVYFTPENAPDTAQ